MRALALSLTLTLTTFAAAQAAQSYYVAKTGSDTNSGTEASPFLTITHAIGLLDEPDDRIYVKAGTYNEHVQIWDKHGSLATPIRVQGYGTDVPIIDGTGIDENGLVEIGDSSYVNFDQFEVQNAIAHGIFIYNADNIKVRYNKVHGSQECGINAYTSSSSNFGTTHDISILNNRVYDNVKMNSTGNASSWQQGLSAYRANNVQIIDNSVYENYGEGIDFIMSNNGLISHNRVRDNFSANIYLDNATLTTVERNFIHSYEYTAYYRNGDPAGGIVMANEDYTVNNVTTHNPLDNIKIYNNIILRAGNGIQYGNWDYGHGLHHTLIANNTIYGAKYYDLYLQLEKDSTNAHDTTTIVNNAFVQSASTKNYASAPTSNITYSNNLWYGGNSSSTISGTNDRTGNPMFAELGGWDDTDYAIALGSDCIDHGASQSSTFTSDYFSTSAVRTGTYDIGADEY
ncbi:MAG TPA: right-handed parallel beta-helix repeat-containing protein [Thermoanaerobaculia bacterium]|nr:right-handed parallel beta-helix repeat-containing protein [Thermoanaerobaculia bacterium]